MKYNFKLVLFVGIVLLLVGCSPTQYTVRFIDWDNTTILEKTLNQGDLIVSPVNLTREGYRFIGWDQEFTYITSDLTINAQYEINTYQVRFYDDQESLLKEEFVLFGENATAPVVLNRDQYEFSHWDLDFTDVRSDLDITAVFEEKEYTIQFYDGSTKLSLGITSYKLSENITLPMPTKTGYAFAGWFLSDISLYEIVEIKSSLAGNLRLYSRWVKTDQNQFTAPSNAIEFIQINKNPHSSGNGYVYQPQFPTGAPTTSVTQYNWESSNIKVATISSYSSISIASAGYAIITGTLKTDSSVVYYCVIQTSADGVVKATLEEANAPSYVFATFQLSDEVNIEKIVQKGGFAVAPTAPVKEGYIFTGWVGENQETIYNITHDTTFVPTYIAGNHSYAGKTISILGDSITTYAGYIPDGFAHFYPYPTADLADMNQTWWMKFINHYGMELLVNNSWSGSAVSAGGSSAGYSMERLKYLYIGEVKPDVILIFMGANDAPSVYITLEQFDIAYGQMINNIKSSSPNSEIVLCTLPSISLYTAADQESHNAVIKKYAAMYEITVIDFTTAFTRSECSQYLVDSAHPNKAGMEKLAEVAIRDFGQAIQ
ncbi:MAG: InlB B-repeat-containing protein [Bacilli bacterium]